MKRALVSAVLSLQLLGHGLAEEQGRAPVRADRAGDGRWVIQNDLPVAVAVLLVGTAGDRRSYCAMRVDPKQVRPACTDGGAASVDLISVEALSERALKKETCKGAGLDLSAFQEVDANLKKTQVSETGAAESAVSAKRRAGDLEAENWWEWRLHEMSDPYRQKYIESLIASNSPQANVELAKDQAELQHGPGLAATMASAYEMSERRELWSRDAKLLEPFVANLATVRETVENQVRDVKALAKAAKEFGQLAVDALARNDAGDLGLLSISRLCGNDPAGVADQALIFSSPPADAKPLAVVLRFDDGTRAAYEAFASQRERGRWVLTFFWPSGAKSVEVRVARGKSIGTLAAGREDLESTAKRLSKAESSARRRLKQAKWFSEGGAQTSNGVVIQ